MEIISSGLVLLQITAIVNCSSSSSMFNIVILMLHLHFAHERSFFTEVFLKGSKNHLESVPLSVKAVMMFWVIVPYLGGRKTFMAFFSQPHNFFWFWFSWVWNSFRCETDQIFRCCKVHDECYERIMSHPGLCNFSSAVYWKIYTRDDTCTGCGKFEYFAVFINLPSVTSLTRRIQCFT